MRPALELLAELASLGVTARLAGPETLVLSPPERLPSGLLMRLRAAKPAVLAEVQARVAARDQVLVDAFDRLADWPSHHCDVRKLSGPLQGFWRVRVGDYRALFTVNAKKRLIVVTRTGSRQTIY